MEKNADKPKKVRIKRENADSKNTNKQANTKSNLKKSFFQVDVIWLGPSCKNMLSTVGTGNSRLFLCPLKAVMPFINITETMTLRSSSLEPKSKYTFARLF